MHKAKPKSDGPRCLVIDIETAPLSSYHWGLFDQNISHDQIQLDWSVLSFSCKWLGEKPVYYFDTGGRGKDKVRDDSELLKKLWGFLDEASLIIGQNVAAFDLKKINARMLEARMAPYSPVRIVDTLLEAKKIGAFTSNKLAFLSSRLTVKKKSEHKRFPGFSLWAAYSISAVYCSGLWPDGR